MYSIKYRVKSDPLKKEYWGTFSSEEEVTKSGLFEIIRSEKLGK